MVPVHMSSCSRSFETMADEYGFDGVTFVDDESFLEWHCDECVKVRRCIFGCEGERLGGGDESDGSMGLEED